MNVSPNTTGLPGITSLESIVGALLTFGLIAAVAGIAISAIAWERLGSFRRATMPSSSSSRSW